MHALAIGRLDLLSKPPLPPKCATVAPPAVTSAPAQAIGRRGAIETLAMQSRPSWLAGGGEWNHVSTAHESMSTCHLGTMPAHVSELQLAQQTQPPAECQAFGAYSQQVTFSLGITHDAL